MLAGDEPGELLSKFHLDPSIAHLNHGAFGACPIEVLDYQSELRRRLEKNPFQFFIRDLEALLDDARTTVGRLLGARPEDLAFVPNATTAVNAVVRSLRFERGDEILTTDHAYNACKNALDFVAEREGVRVVVADVPFPLHSPDEVVERICAAASSRTRLAVIDHVSSQTALVLPIDRIVASLRARGIDVLVDGAHAPGMVEVDLDHTGAAYTTGNCHKWLCAPKGAAYLHVRRDRQDRVRPLTISHGANIARANRSRYLLEFDWMGTDDPTPWLSIPRSIAFLEHTWPGGLAALRRRNHDLALRARDALVALVGGSAPAPDAMLGSLAAVVLPLGAGGVQPLDTDPLASRLAEQGIEVPVFTWSSPAKRLLRVSAQLYNRWPDYERLLSSLSAELAA